jgi:hypothetical protein
MNTCGWRPRVLPIAARYRFGASAARRRKASGVAPLGQGCGLAAHGAVLIDQLPHHAVLDKEAAARLGDAPAGISGGEAMAGDVIEKFLARLAGDRLG